MKWIGVEDRLPEKDGEYIVYQETRDYVSIENYADSYPVKWYNAFFPEDECYYYITHWIQEQE